MLGNAPNWNDCTIREPQIPSTWSGDTITIKVNFGAIGNDGPAYLYVFDANNNHNTSGFSIRNSQNTINNPPQNLRIVSGL
jgi:hypothetical protein